MLIFNYLRHMGNSFGQIFRITTFGESHGPAIGVVIDGCPAGLEISGHEIQLELDRRKPGQSAITTQRKESDLVEVLSGIFEDKTLGSPIAMLIRNEDARPEDYAHLKDTFRPSHADFTYEAKYGRRDYRGGGRASARETACRVAAGAVARKLLESWDISVTAYTSSIGKEGIGRSYRELDFSRIEHHTVRCPDDEKAKEFIRAIEEARDEGDSLGGVVTCVIRGCPPGWGEPVYDKMEAELAKGMMSINASKGFEIGSGFGGTREKGSIHNDVFEYDGKKIRPRTNNSGGVQGGISNGMDIFFRVAFKPVSTLMQKQQSVNKKGEEVIIEGKGRHDPCIVPRAVPVVEAMAALVIADMGLRNRLVGR